MVKAINQRIANTDIFVFGYEPSSQIFTYSRPFTQKEAEDLAGATNQDIKVQYGNAKGLKSGLGARDGSLVNMNTLKGIIANINKTVNYL